MAEYDLSRFTIYLVEDNGYIRRILEEMFRDFGFGRVITAENGAEAVDYFKTLKGNPQMAASLGPDMVISDLIMSPIDGLLLLRWIRTAKESPDRFVPFVMLSGAADNDNVNQARELGSTEFLAKPFSAQSVYKRILEVIDYPRQFITTTHYFGPDRRRRKSGSRDEERRQTKDDDVTIVYSADKVVKPKEDSDVWYFRLPNRLKEKAGGVAGEPGVMPTKLLKEAENKLERAALDFTQLALGYLKQMSRHCEEAVKQEGSRAQQFQAINLLAHELRGQGGTFGYPLISTFGKMLYDITGAGCRKEDTAVEIVKSHMDVMRAVIRDKVAGDGGEIGRALLQSLKAAVDKISMVE